MNTILYLCINAFHTYVMFVAMGLFFGTRTASNAKLAFLLLAGNGINSAMYLLFHSPYINLASYLLMLFLASLAFQGRTSIRLLSIVLLCIVGTLMESLSYSVLSYLSLEEYAGTLGNLVSSLLFLVLFLLLKKVMNSIRNQNLSWFHVAAILSIPIGSIILVVAAAVFSSGIEFTVIMAVTLLLMNLIVFYIYNVLTAYYHELAVKKLIRQQGEAYLNEVVLVKESQSKLRKLRHDMKNHLLALEAMLTAGNSQGALDYLDSMQEYLRNSKEFISTGNADVDSIVNYKLGEIEALGAAVDVHVSIPEALETDPFDLVVILGNLLDNACEALRETADKELYLGMKLEHSMVYLSVTNTSDRPPNRSGSSKADAQNHGLGLVSVEDALKKYGGTIEYRYRENRFTADVLFSNSPGKQKSNFNKNTPQFQQVATQPDSFVLRWSYQEIQV